MPDKHLDEIDTKENRRYCHLDEIGTKRSKKRSCQLSPYDKDKRRYCHLVELFDEGFILDRAEVTGPLG